MEGTVLKTVLWCLLENSGVIILPESLLSTSPLQQKRWMSAFQICCAQLLLTQFKFTSSGSKLADGARPQEGNTYREKGPPEKLCLLPSKGLTSNYSQGPEVLAEKGDLKSLRKACFPLWQHADNLVRPCSPTANGMILVGYGYIFWASFPFLASSFLFPLDKFTHQAPQP